MELDYLDVVSIEESTALENEFFLLNLGVELVTVLGIGLLFDLFPCSVEVFRHILAVHLLRLGGKDDVFFHWYATVIF